jgi:hypothetical protein
MQGTHSTPWRAVAAAGPPSPELLATLSVYLSLGGAALLAVVAYKVPGPDVPLKTWIVLAGVIASLMLLSGVSACTWAWRRSMANRLAGFHAPVLFNLFVVALLAGGLEITARVLAQPDPFGQRLAGRVLLPYDWAAVAGHNAELLKQSRSGNSYFVEDAALGWRIAPSRASTDGLYFSSAEGLRSARQGEALLPVSGKSRIAFFGDSFAFSEEVPFDQSLTKHLERRMGEKAQVITFGIPGYGIDQAVLQMEQQVARWKPDVSVLQFIEDDIQRIGNIYLFNKPTWAYPFVKPRFLSQEGQLTQLQVPSPQTVFARESVHTLPHLEKDLDFREQLWRDSPLFASRAASYLLSHSPRESPARLTDGPSSNEALAVRLIERFVASARAAGSRPVVVYFPDAGDFRGYDRSIVSRVLAGLDRLGIDVVDTSDCMTQAGGVDEHIVTDGAHYSNGGNARMAQCLEPVLRQQLSLR